MVHVTSLKVAVVLVAALALSACATQPIPASVSGFELVFHDPGFAVQGKTHRDQVWISETQETGIQVLGWKRPVPVKKVKVHKPKVVTPVAQPMEQPIARPVVNGTPLPTEKPLVITPVKKHHWWQRKPKT